MWVKWEDNKACAWLDSWPWDGCCLKPGQIAAGKLPANKKLPSSRSFSCYLVLWVYRNCPPTWTWLTWIIEILLFIPILTGKVALHVRPMQRASSKSWEWICIINDQGSNPKHPTCSHLGAVGFLVRPGERCVNLKLTGWIYGIVGIVINQFTRAILYAFFITSQYLLLFLCRYDAPSDEKSNFRGR